MDVASWLRDLGLERYEAAFRENDVSAEVLCHLTAEDLEGLGVTAIGHRRRLLVAIAALRPEGPSAGDPVRLSSDSPISPTANLGSSETTAERRPLSVMFCDLIGSTALSSRLDPEDLREVIRTYQACVADTIRQFDGFIARYVGDGVLIYFGWPEARETDAERAVRAGLAVAAAVSATPVGGEPLHVRIGIATGLVVIGEPIGSGDSRQQTAVGETPNLAARLQGLAGPLVIKRGAISFDRASKPMSLTPAGAGSPYAFGAVSDVYRRIVTFHADCRQTIEYPGNEAEAEAEQRWLHKEWAEGVHRDRTADAEHAQRVSDRVAVFLANSAPQPSLTARSGLVRHIGRTERARQIVRCGTPTLGRDRARRRPAR